MSHEYPDINTDEGRIEMIADDVQGLISSGGDFDPGDPQTVYHDTMTAAQGFENYAAEHANDPPADTIDGGPTSETPEPPADPHG